MPLFSTVFIWICRCVSLCMWIIIISFFLFDSFCYKNGLWSVQIHQVIRRWPKTKPKKNQIYEFFCVNLSSILCNCVLCLYAYVYMHKLIHSHAMYDTIHTDNFHFLFDFLMISAIKSSALADYRNHHIRISWKMGLSLFKWNFFRDERFFFAP